jgi:hypothetical protein
MQVAIAVIDFSNGEVTNARGDVVHQARAVAAPVSQAVAPATVQHLDAIDEFNAHIARAIRTAQGMSDADKRRASEFMEAARGMLTAVTRLSSGEQRRFENAMRSAARE